MKKFNSVPYDSADYLKTGDDVIAYLEASLEENDSEFFIYALGACRTKPVEAKKVWVESVFVQFRGE